MRPTPPGYPTARIHDTFATRPFADDFETRRQAYLEFQAAQPGHGPYHAAARMALGLLPDEQRMLPALEKIDAREDCADFVLHGILRVLYQFGDGPLLGEAFKARAKKTVLGFKYWPDEPGVDSMCSWTENHYILFAAGGYLAGQLYPDEVFSNSGQTGREKRAVCRPRILRWLDLRFRAGFSEWLSNVYYDEDLTALLNLVELCRDDEIARRTAMVMDLMLLDMALNQYRGVFGCTHGRTYEKEKKWADDENTGALFKLAFGLHTFQTGNMSATLMALNRRYQIPEVICQIAADGDREEMVNRQRVSIRIEEAERWGLDVNRLEDGMLFLTFEAYAHPRTIDLMMRMLDEYRWWENDFFKPIAQRRDTLNTARALGALPYTLWWFRHDVQRSIREEANLYTYRTPDYLLSSAQDYKKGYGGDQQHIWQATLGPDAVCFTTHPAGPEQESPGYWTGSGNLPRVAQVKNVALILYRISPLPGLYVTHTLHFTHAWLPKDKFDEVVEQDGWVFARKGDGYLALWSQQPWHWQTEEGEDKNRELIAPGLNNIWICELGRKKEDGLFAEFIERIRRAELTSEGLQVRYDSPSQGRLEFDWDNPLEQNGRTVALGDYPRYDNPYVNADFPGEVVRVHHTGHSLKLKWETLEREVE